MRRFAYVASIGFAVGLAPFLERDAQACGGCFAPPEDPTSVSDHRMILSVSAEQTTLYDQIRYAGSPKSFAWVLPISGRADIGLSSDTLFNTIASNTAVSVIAPPRNCPPPPVCNDYDGVTNAPRAGFASADASAPAPSVVVTEERVVGPYETVQLKSTDAAALTDWLTSHGYSIPDDIKPLIAAYVGEHYDFLALKLVPNANVNSMRPVRVTTKGASPTLPLRMVAAGTGASVGLALWVIGDGRYEPQNFPVFQIKESELAWTWATQSSNYSALRASKTTASNGSAWEIESSLVQYKSNIEQIVRNQANPNFRNPQVDGGGIYPPEPATDAGAAKSSVEVMDADLTTLFKGMPNDTVRVTRLRADLGRAALANDLVLKASADQSEVSNLRRVTAETDEPSCPVYTGCNVSGQAPRAEAARLAAQRSNVGTGSCAVRPGIGANVAYGAGLGGLALAGVAMIRRRRRNG